MLTTTKFDENSDLSTTYLGRIDMTRLDKIIAEEKFPIQEQVNYFCLNHIILGVNICICYLTQRIQVGKEGMDNT